ncbi:MAG: glutathione S-transferase family protein [Methylovulum sp.]|nr:glutathione S-transferase family protein [Methylovulum sp.]
MMQLIGMLDSPYVRRVSISLHTMGIPFEHKALSVFSTFTAFQRINPVVKAPSLVCANGDVLMDSSLILDYAQSWVPLERQLLPSMLPEKQKALRLLGLALAACEKSVQIVYEKNLRPQEKQHQPWLDRVQGQLLAAYTVLEAELRICPLSAGVSQAAITTAVTWQFSQMMLADIVGAQEFPLLHALSDESETLEAFMAYPPTGPGVKTV